MPAGLPTPALYALHPVYTATLWFLLLFATCALAVLLLITAPYGRHAREGWGPTVPAVAGWVIVEAPAFFTFAIVLASTPRGLDPVPLGLGLLYLAHYAWRTFVFPFRLRGTEGKTHPLLTVGLAILFNLCNASACAYALGALSPHLTAAWLTDPRFLLGVILFVAGWTLNHQSDAILRNLRAPGETGYRIPEGGMFRWVSAPNYLGELIEWTGWALACWTAAAWVFVWFTASNLVPRALANHRWYRDTFEHYPPERRALLPYLL